MRIRVLNPLLAVAFAVTLAGCGGGGGGTSAPLTQTVSGVVADGYLKGATVCLDTNGNKKCDAGEPTASSGDGGVFSIPNVASADLANFPIVVEVPAGAVDSERGAVVTPYILTAPAGRPEVVSPLTTLVQNQIEANGLTVAAAEAAVKNQLGFTTLSPLADYKPGVSGAGAEAVMAAGVAKVIVTTIADSKKAIEAAVTGSTPNQVLNLIVQQVMQNLSAVVLQVKTATNNGATTLAESSVAGIVTSSGVKVATTDTATLQAQLTAAGASNADAGPKLTISLQGANASSVKGIQTIVTFPAALLLRADTAGKPFSGVVAATGTAASGLLEGKYTPATATTPATLNLGLITTGALGTGDIIVINTSLTTPGSAAPAASSVTTGSTTLIDLNGNPVSGVTLSLR